jgi:hypothetical protein
MSDRSRRRCVLRKTAVPDATHYVGYVEDEETPEMIMKKFEEMERIKATHKKSAVQQQADVAGPSSTSAALEAAVDKADTAEQQAAAADGGGQLDQQQLQEIFKATSMYNVKSLLGNNEALMVDAAAKQQADRGPASEIAFDSGGATPALLSTTIPMLAQIKRVVSNSRNGDSACTTLPCLRCTPVMCMAC